MIVLTYENKQLNNQNKTCNYLYYMFCVDKKAPKCSFSNSKLVMNYDNWKFTIINTYWLDQKMLGNSSFCLWHYSRNFQILSKNVFSWFLFKKTALVVNWKGSFLGWKWQKATYLNYFNKSWFHCNWSQFAKQKGFLFSFWTIKKKIGHCV